MKKEGDVDTRGEEKKEKKGGPCPKHLQDRHALRNIDLMNVCITDLVKTCELLLRSETLLCDSM